MNAKTVTTARLRRWVLAAVCGAVGPAAMAAETAPAVLPAGVPGGVAVITTGGCAAGGCDTAEVWTHKGKKEQRKAERKEILRATKSCAHTPARQVPPIGTFTREAFDTQRDNALVEYFVVFDIEWLLGTPDLNGYGCRHLDGICRRLGQTASPVKIEASGIPALDEARKSTIITKLVQCGMDPAAAAARVIFGCTRAEGLRYDEIEAVYYNGRFGGSYGFGNGFGGGIGGFAYGYGR
jgi:hypothetical protein